MRGRVTVVLLVSLALTTSLFGKEVFLSITGKANGFFTDARIFNPSFTKDITVNAQYLPGNSNNTGAAVVPLVIPKRSMRVFDDAVQSMFGGGPALGAIRLTSDDDFVASQRIYQDARSGPQKGTLGQFVPGLDVSAAKTKGVILQLKSGDATLGSFRTNWGGVNPNTTVANITLKLYDKSNAVVATKTHQIQPYGMVSPTNIASFFEVPATIDLTDSWIGFTSDVPVMLYGSCVDGGSSDPTFIPASDDSGTPPPPEPEPGSKTINVTAQNWSFNIQGANDLKKDDEVKFIIRSAQDLHGFRLFSPEGATLVTVDPVGANATEKIIRLTSTGTYTIVCTRLTCGEGHTDMVATFNVEEGTVPGDRY